MGRFDNLVAQPAGVGRFDNLISQENTGRFSNLNPVPAIKSVTSVFGGAIGKLGRILTTPQEATTGLIEKGLEKTGILKPTLSGLGVKQAVQSQESNIDLLRRIGTERGGGLLTGQYTPTTSVFGNFVKELPVTVLGTLGDIFLDPTTYLAGAGIFRKGAKAVGGLIKTGAKSLAEEIPAVQKMGDILGRAFINRYGQSEAFKTADIARKIAESSSLENARKLVSPIIEKPAFIQQRITQVIKGLGTEFDKNIKSLADPIRQELDRVGESISKLNPKLLDPKTFEANKGTYFPRLYTDYQFPEDEQGVIQSSFGSRTVSIPKEPFMKRTLTEAQSVAKGTRIEEAGLPALKRLSQLGVVEERQKFFKEASKLASTEPKPGWIQFSDDKALGDLAGKFLPAPEYKAIADIRKIPGPTEQLYNKSLTIWKTFKTAYNPATIARNDLTNFFILNPLGGVGPHRLDIYARTANEILTKGPMYQMARKEGLEISTQQAAELTNQASRFYTEHKGIISQFFNKMSDFHKMVGNFYGSQDKYFKLANFIKGVREDGLTSFEAMRRANFYLVDYSEVPEFVKWLRKSPIGIPFISFTYGVSKPLAKTLLERPDRLSNYFKILRGIQLMNPQGETPQERQHERDVAPDWIQQGTFLRLPVHDKYGRGQYVDLQYILPFNILESRSIRPGNPLMNILGSTLSNRDLFTGKDITTSTDTPIEKAQKYVTNILGQLLPSLTPGVGTSFNKILNTLRGRPDRNGFVKSKLQTLVDVLGGIKITPIDATLQGQIRSSAKAKDIQALRSELKKIMLDKSLFPAERQREAQSTQKKIQDVVQTP